MTTASQGKLFALIPAAGRSRRMGSPKLLLKLREETIICRLVRVLKAAGVDRILVLVRSDDLNLQQVLKSLACEPVIADHDPPEMRDSVELLIKHVTVACHPCEHDRWLLIPADHPFAESPTVKRLITESQNSPGKIVLPIYQGRRGHPTLFPWTVVHEVSQIPHDQGLNWLVRQDSTRVLEVPVTQESVLFDLNTPEDYEKARNVAVD